MYVQRWNISAWRGLVPADARFEMRMPASLKVKLEREAAGKGLSLASYVKMICIEAVRWKPPRSGKSGRRR